MAWRGLQGRFGGRESPLAPCSVLGPCLLALGGWGTGSFLGAQQGPKSPACHPSLLLISLSVFVPNPDLEWGGDGVKLEEKINSKDVERVKRRMGVTPKVIWSDRVPWGSKKGAPHPESKQGAPLSFPRPAVLRGGNQEALSY